MPLKRVPKFLALTLITATLTLGISLSASAAPLSATAPAATSRAAAPAALPSNAVQVSHKCLGLGSYKSVQGVFCLDLYTSNRGDGYTNVYIAGEAYCQGGGYPECAFVKLYFEAKGLGQYFVQCGSANGGSPSGPCASGGRNVWYELVQAIPTTRCTTYTGEILLASNNGGGPVWNAKPAATPAAAADYTPISEIELPGDVWTFYPGGYFTSVTEVNC